MNRDVGPHRWAHHGPVGPSMPAPDPHGHEVGRVTAFVTIVTAGLFVLAGLVLDGGLALSARVRALNEAREAARAGAQELDLAAFRADGTVRLDPARARGAALAYLDAAHRRQGSATSSAVVAVTADRVEVRVTTAASTQILQVVGVTTVTVTGQASAVAATGVTAPDP